MIGQTAPQFSLEASTGTKISLCDLVNSYVVLIFYPANDTPTCNAQLDEMNIEVSQFLSHNARVFGVNTAQAEKHREYCTRRRIEFPILSDPKGETAKSYKATWNWLTFYRRTVVVIDPSGEVCYYERGKPDAANVLEFIKEYEAKRTHLRGH